MCITAIFAGTGILATVYRAQYERDSTMALQRTSEGRAIRHVFTDEQIAHFWNGVHKADGCWEWTRHRVCKYGALSIKGQQWKAHRVAYTLTHGPIPDGMCVCHRCDNPPCCNPDHLFLGTAGENNADRNRKGRSGGNHHPTVTFRERPLDTRGEANGRAKLTWDIVREIRARYNPETFPTRAIARAYGISKATAFQIVARKNWIEVSDEL